MKHLTRILLAAFVTGLAACVGPNLPSPPPLPSLPGMSRPEPVYQQQQSYLPDEYRSGYDIGNRDAAYGYPPDSRRAYDRFGHGSEGSFSEGYADGYERRAPRR